MLPANFGAILDAERCNERKSKNVSNLELKIPPVLVALLSAGMTWLVARFTPALPLPLEIRTALCITFLLAGAIVGLAGVRSFRKARTTVNPLNPASASSLVVNGIFQYTRNPMYLALLFLLIALCACFENAYSLAVPAAFVWYMNRFQIGPEERAMERLFGSEFLDYKARVRRWI